MSVINLESFRFPSNDLDEKLANVAMNHIDEAVMITDSKNRIIYINEKFEQTTGYSFTEVQGKTPKALQSGVQEFSFYEKMKESVNETGKWKGELWNRSKNGKVNLQSLSVIAIKDSEGNIQNFVGVFSNMFKSKIKESDQLQSISSYYDTLTDLPTRIIFEKRSLATLKRAEQNGESFAIIFFELEDFNRMREKYGSLYSDILLKRIATKLKNNVPGTTLITRWNETSFASILEDIQDKEQVRKFVEVLNEELTTPIIVNGIENYIKASFGITIFNEDGKTISELLANAHAAMKKARVDNVIYKFCTKDIMNPNNFFVMEFELERAINQKQFELYYQPLVDVATMELKGFEALVRWNHPTAGIISPLKFIPLAEQTGLIYALGDFVFNQACEQLSDWRSKGHHDLTLSVNISMSQFQDQHLVENIERSLKAAGVPPEQMVIELTESSLSENKEETITKLHELKTLGLSIALDDFGTGYSSLGYIIDYPVDKLKIDRSFIRVLEENKKIEAIVSAINTMAKTMDITVVAEGIETEGQLAIIQKLACDIAQGYLFDKAVPKDEAELKWLN